MIRSANEAAFAQNNKTLFHENYGLAYTQNLKNKDIPEFGSKGTILLLPGSQEKGFRVSMHACGCVWLCECLYTSMNVDT